MADKITPVAPAGHVPGTNLTLSELIRLVGILCLPPWLFGAAIILTGLTAPPDTALGWIMYVAAGPAAWGVFISAVVDGRTLLHRPKEPGTRRRSWLTELRTPPTVTVQPVGGDQIRGRTIATHGSVVNQGAGVASKGDSNFINTGEIGGSVEIRHGDTYELPPGPVADPQSLRQAYLNRVLEQTQTLQLTGVDPKAAREPSTQTGLALAAVYTALMTRSQAAPDRGTPAGDAHRTDQDQALSAVAVLDKDRKLALLGDPGGGKSTFVNFVALCLAGEALGRTDANLALMTTPLPVEDEARRTRDEKPRPQPWRHGALLPVRVVLRDLAARGLPPVGQKATGDHLWRFIAGELGETLVDYAPHLKRELRETGGLVLLDGLDEVPDADQRRVQVKQAVQGFAADFPRCRFVVTSRTYAYQRQDWKLDGFGEAMLAPFSPPQIGRFVDGWYVHLAAVRGQDPNDAQGRATLLKDAIRRSERLAELA